MKLYQKYKYFIFDLDGTVYRGNKIIPGAAETINQLKSCGKKVVFVSNKTTGNSYDYFNFLLRNHITISPDEIITSTAVIKNYLSKNFFNKNFFAVAEQKFIDEISEAGLVYSSDKSEIEIVIITLDRTFNFDKLEIAAEAIGNGAKFFAANIDDTCPVENGEVLDAGSVISALEKRTKRKLELHFGKPSEFMIKEIKRRIEFETDKTLIVGDRLETDIAMGINFGIDTALVTTGIKNISNSNGAISPTYQLNSIADLLTFSLSSM
ncbi:HAD-IIA family hydrolase [Ignavibacterium album]|uniref:HAD-IIA family hydrolase n=1 Tax=Ignavibacterium album TaxID=591197 RepID=UPI0035B6FE37